MMIMMIVNISYDSDDSCSISSLNRAVRVDNADCSTK